MRTLYLVIGIGIVVGSLVALFADPLAISLNNKSATSLFRLFSIFVAGSMPFLIVDGLFLPVGRTGLASLFNILTRLVVLTSCALPVWIFGASLEQAVIVLGLSQISLTVFLILTSAWTYRSSGGNENIVRIKEQVKYALPIIGAGVFGALFIQLDKLVVSLMATPEIFAVYSNGALENPLVQIVTVASSVVIAAELVQVRDAGDHAGFVTLWSRAIRKIGTLVIPMSCFLFAFSYEAVVLLFSSKYSDSSPIFAVYVMLAPIRIVSFGTLFMALNKNRYYLLGHIIACVANVPVVLLGYFLLGPLGAAIGVVIVSYVLAAGLLRIGARELKTELKQMFPWRSLLNILVSVIPATLISRLLVNWLDLGMVLGLIAGGVLFTIIGGVSMIASKAVDLGEWPILGRISILQRR